MKRVGALAHQPPAGWPPPRFSLESQRPQISRVFTVRLVSSRPRRLVFFAFCSLHFGRRSPRVFLLIVFCSTFVATIYLSFFARVLEAKSTSVEHANFVGLRSSLRQFGSPFSLAEKGANRENRVYLRDKQASARILNFRQNLPFVRTQIFPPTASMLNGVYDYFFGEPSSVQTAATANGGGRATSDDADWCLVDRTCALLARARWRSLALPRVRIAQAAPTSGKSDRSSPVLVGAFELQALEDDESNDDGVATAANGGRALAAAVAGASALSSGDARRLRKARREILAAEKKRQVREALHRRQLVQQQVGADSKLLSGPTRRLQLLAENSIASPSPSASPRLIAASSSSASSSPVSSAPSTPPKDKPCTKTTLVLNRKQKGRAAKSNARASSNRSNDRKTHTAYNLK